VIHDKEGYSSMMYKRIRGNFGFLLFSFIFLLHGCSNGKGLTRNLDLSSDDGEQRTHQPSDSAVEKMDIQNGRCKRKCVSEIIS